MLYSLVRVLLDVMATSHSNEAKLRAEVLSLRWQVQVLERQIKRVRWEPGDRMILAAAPAWAAGEVNRFDAPTGTYVIRRRNNQRSPPRPGRALAR